VQDDASDDVLVVSLNRNMWWTGWIIPASSFYV
jgi:hypothetical protein